VILQGGHLARCESASRAIHSTARLSRSTADLANFRFRINLPAVHSRSLDLFVHCYFFESGALEGSYSEYPSTIRPAERTPTSFAEVLL